MEISIFHISIFLGYLSASLQSDKSFMYMLFLSSVIPSLVGEKTDKSTMKIPYPKYCERNTHSTLMELRGEAPRLWSGAPGARR